MSSGNSVCSAKSSVNRVQQELHELRRKSIAKNRRDKLKDLTTAPLTTPEEAQAFLATMRDKSKVYALRPEPPSNLSADGMDAWYLQQREREQELRRRRKEAEQILRGYRMSAPSTPSMGGCMGGDSPMSSHHHHHHHYHHQHQQHHHGETLELHDDHHHPDDMTEASRMLKEDLGMSGGGGKMSLPSSASSRHHNNNNNNNNNNNYHLPHPPHHHSSNIHNHHHHNPSAATTTSSSMIEEKKVDDMDHNNNRSQQRLMTPQKFFVEETIWRDFISFEPNARFRPESGRYHLYASYACPGSHRALIVRAMKGLEDAISVTIVHPTWRHTNPQDPNDRHRGWVFGDPYGKPFSNTIGRGGPFPSAYPGNEPDPIFHAYSIREIYEQAEDTSGKYTIPLLWDKQLNTIVNNESSDIAYMLNSCFNNFATNPTLDLFTEDDEMGMDKLNEVSEWLYPLMIHGVYRCGFAKSQNDYDRAINELTAAFDKADAILSRQRYLTGNIITDADIRLFVTLLRFDEVYAFYFKANTRLVMLTPSLLNFCREIYQVPGVAGTCSMEQIKAHFFGSHAEWNKYSVIPRGLGFIELLDMEHDRDGIYNGGDEQQQQQQQQQQLGGGGDGHF